MMNKNEIVKKKILTKSQGQVVRQITGAIQDHLVTNNPKDLVGYLHAPTGAGKTFIIANTISRIINSNISNVFDEKDFVFIFLAPGDGDLAGQNFHSIKKSFSNNEVEQFPIHQIGNNIPNNEFKANNVYFIKWSSVSNKRNVLLNENERGCIYDILSRSFEKGSNLFVVIDEEHLKASSKNNRTKATRFLENMISSAKENDRKAFVLRASATPTYKIENIVNSKYSVYRYFKLGLLEARDDNLIRERVKHNHDVDYEEWVKENTESYFGDIFSKEIISRALKQREVIKNRCNKLYIENMDKIHESFKNYNPLVIIQIENNKKDEESVLHELENLLYNQLKISRESVAVWLSDQKKTGGRKLLNKELKELITKDDSPINILIFKQAIATGWDIPRSQVYVKIRNITSKNFQIQTLGRVLRNSYYFYFEQCKEFYNDSVLNSAYVYSPERRDDMEKELNSFFIPKGANKRDNVNALYAPVKQSRKSDKFLSVENYIETNKDEVAEYLLNEIKADNDYAVYKNSNSGNFFDVIKNDLLTNYETTLDRIEIHTRSITKRVVYLDKADNSTEELLEGTGTTSSTDDKIVDTKFTLVDLERLYEGTIGKSGTTISKIILCFLEKLWKQLDETLLKVKKKSFMLWVINNLKIRDFNYKFPFALNKMKGSLYEILTSIIKKKVFSMVSREESVDFGDPMTPLPSKMYIPENEIQGNTRLANIEGLLHAYNAHIITNFLEDGSRQEKLEDKTGEILWDSVWEKYFYSYLCNNKDLPLEILKVFRNEAGCFFDFSIHLKYFNDRKDSFIDTYKPDFLLFGNGFQIICDTKGEHNTYNKKGDFWEDDAFYKLKWTSKFLEKYFDYDPNETIAIANCLVTQQNKTSNYFAHYWNNDLDRIDTIPFAQFVDLVRKRKLPGLVYSKDKK